MMSHLAATTNHSKKRSFRHRVHFHEHTNEGSSAVVTQLFPVMNRQEYSDSEKKACWWTASDRKVCKQMAKRMIQKHVQCYEPHSKITSTLSTMQESARSVARMLNSSNNSNSSIVANAKSDDAVSMSLLASMISSYYITWVSSSAGSIIRGVEKQVSLCVAACGQCWSSYHRSMESSAIRDLVLRMQAAGCTIDEIADVYAAQCQINVVYAHCMGRADEFAATIE
jgi:hypothetical protein